SLHGAKADRQAVDGAGSQQREQFTGARHVGNEFSAREQAAVVLAQVEPDADRLGWIVLEQHRHAPNAAPEKRLPERAFHHLVAGLVDLAEQRGIAFDRSVRPERRSRREHGSDGRFCIGCEHGKFPTTNKILPSSASLTRRSMKLLGVWQRRQVSAWRAGSCFSCFSPCAEAICAARHGRGDREIRGIRRDGRGGPWSRRGSSAARYEAYPSLAPEHVVETREFAHEFVETPACCRQFAQREPGKCA